MLAPLPCYSKALANLAKDPSLVQLMEEGAQHPPPQLSVCPIAGLFLALCTWGRMRRAAGAACNRGAAPGLRALHASRGGWQMCQRPDPSPSCPIVRVVSS